MQHNAATPGALTDQRDRPNAVTGAGSPVHDGLPVVRSFEDEPHELNLFPGQLRWAIGVLDCGP